MAFGVLRKLKKNIIGGVGVEIQNVNLLSLVEGFNGTTTEYLFIREL